ncbi:signal transduction histidine kinase [Nitrosomonas ureae]|uniref:cache domain-containing protein n=1 Tax=Nitrosomonas ureae TaxID=44577 RepID=UPI000D924AB7|nr:cache domain-containing protein [Nitrosomonas ureae]PXX09478.1 signal transduction histidine kinase [Nitrosomonas ureae]
MKIQNKMILTIVGVVIGLISLIVIIIWSQMNELKIKQDKVIEDAYRIDKEKELKNMLSIAKTAIEHLYEVDDIEVAQEEAKKILTNLRYDGHSGYYFSYTPDGVTLVHPYRKQWVTSKEPKRDYYVCRYNSEDKNCAENEKIYVIRDLIDAALKKGEGLLKYPFYYPEDGTNKQKLSYVETIDKWNWVLGTGVYVDQIESTLEIIKKQNDAHLKRTLIFIGLATLFGLISIGWILHRLGKDSVFNRMSSDLHSGVCYKLYETIDYINENKRSPNQGIMENIHQKVWSASEGLWSLMDKRSASSRLKNRLQTLSTQFSLMNRLPVTLDSEGNIKDVAWAIEDELYNVAQEALLNIKKHAEATKVTILLKGNNNHIELSIEDDGIGFDVNTVDQGGGLSYMRECMEKVGGSVKFAELPEGAKVLAVAQKF